MRIQNRIPKKLVPTRKSPPGHTCHSERSEELQHFVSACACAFTVIPPPKTRVPPPSRFLRWVGTWTLTQPPSPCRCCCLFSLTRTQESSSGIVISTGAARAFCEQRSGEIRFSTSTFPKPKPLVQRATRPLPLLLSVLSYPTQKSSFLPKPLASFASSAVEKSASLPPSFPRPNRDLAFPRPSAPNMRIPLSRSHRPGFSPVSKEFKSQKPQQNRMSSPQTT